MCMYMWLISQLHQVKLSKLKTNKEPNWMQQQWSTNMSMKCGSVSECALFTVNAAFLWNTTVTWRINNEAFNNCVHLCFGGNRFSRKLCAVKQNFPPQQKQHSFPHRKDFLPLTWLSAIINAQQHLHLGCGPHLHTIRDEQLRNVKCLTPGDKVGVGAALWQPVMLKYSTYGLWWSLKYKGSPSVRELSFPFF